MAASSLAAESSSASAPNPQTGFNRFHVCVLFVWQFVNFFSAQMIFGIFSNFTPRWRCQPSLSSPNHASSLMVVANESGPPGLPFGMEMMEMDGAELAPPPSMLYVKDCSAYAECHPELLEFEPAPFGSAALEFDWICGTGSYMRALYSQVQFGGILLGTIFLAPLSDRYGRKPVGLSTFAMAICVLASSAAAKNAQQLLLARFLLCFFIGAAKVVLAAFTMELIPPQCRIYLRTFCNWGISRLLLTSLCFLFPDWRSASVAAACACLPALALLTAVIPESPTWLHSKGKLDDMHRSEQWMARIGGVKYEPVERAELDGKRQNLLTIVRDPDLFGRLMVLWTMWFCSALSAYSIDLNSSTLSGDIFVNQWLLACPVIISKMILLLLDSKCPSFSRRTLHQGSQLIVCLAFLVIISLFFMQYQGILFLLGYFVGITFLEYTWDANYLSAVESMPTQLRASALGSCSMVARIGGFFSPVFVFLNDVWGASAYLAVILLGSLNLVVSYLWLPETKGIDLDEVKFGEDDKERGEHGGKEEEGEEEEGEKEGMMKETKMGEAVLFGGKE